MKWGKNVKGNGAALTLSPLSCSNASELLIKRRGAKDTHNKAKERNGRER
jgi:hypothetical protein